MDLEVNKKVRVRRANVYVYCDRYKLTLLTLDLWTNELFIDVEFYKDTSLILTKKYIIPTQKGRIDVDVDKIIEDLHKRIIDG
jgi:hypothetical protein